MAIIFTASTDGFSAAHTSRFIEPLLLRLFPHISAQALDTIHLCIRKSAHLAEYAILGGLLWLALPEYKVGPEFADWGRAGMAILVATGYAATDEFHQLFVPSRGASGHDVLIDACGASVAVILLCLCNRRGVRQG